MVHPDGDADTAKTHKRRADVPGDENIFYFHLDGKAPLSRPVPKSATQAHNRGVIFFGEPVEIQLVSEDQGEGLKVNQSGVVAVYSSLDGAPFEKVTGPLGFAEERAYELRYYGEDNVGNQEAVRRYRFQIDKTAPNSKLRFRGPESGTFVSPSTLVVLSAQDTGAGVGVTRYQIKGKGGAEGNYQRPINLAGLGQGDYQIHYWSQDKLGNAETAKSQSFTLDRTAPKIEMGNEGPVFREKGNLFVGPNTKLTASVSDNGAGVAWMKYKLDQDSGVYQGPVGLPKKAGRFVFKLWAADKVGNQTQAYEYELTQDPVPPTSHFAFSGPHSADSKGKFIAGSAKVTLSAEDKSSGVKEIGYQLDQGAEGVYREAVTAAAGPHELAYFSTDNVGNREKKNKLHFFVDADPPEITTKMSVGSMGEERFPKGSLLFVIATDKASGLEKVEISINGSKASLLQQPPKFDEPGRYKVELAATDKVGNRSTATVSFLIQ
ncbi:MAG: hypothetical protein A2426_03180 [Candidatus Lambdaproteobacteria bacterium RIFOXYC1_FULL_56_13]|nr:MAG: hypothetical protein A2426_03180 [Candidatus Lambdaproteobacteria bacterium RIFOXYC1_FULL_56_13]